MDINGPFHGYPANCNYTEFLFQTLCFMIALNIFLAIIIEILGAEFSNEFPALNDKIQPNCEI
jgi:hypothetical protein